MRRTIGNETFVNAPSMMQQGEIVSNPDGTGIRNGRVQQPSNAPAPMKIDEVEDEDDEGGIASTIEHKRPGRVSTEFCKGVGA